LIVSCHLYVAWQNKETGLIEGQGDVNSVAAEAVDAEQELDRRLELAGQKENLMEEEKKSD
jgi:hypothetical protein